MQKQEEHKIRDLFLSSFVESIIRGIYEQKYKVSGEIRNALQTQPQIQLNQMPKFAQPIKQPFHQDFKVNLGTAPKMIPQLQKRPQMNMPQKRSPAKAPVTLPQAASNEKAIGVLNLGKINSFLGDPSVFSVESPGPGKNLIINRAGQILPSSNSLTKEEIEVIMKEVSDKTRIPLISGGVFRAAFKDLLITAVVSDYIGTRFLIQKRNPFQRY